jgi:hypothetical protein
MPLINMDDPAEWDGMYEVPRDDGTGRGHFEIACKRHIVAVSNAEGIIKALGINATHKIAMIGAGFGWMAKDVAELSGAVVAAVDTSTYIQTRKAQDAEIEILNADVSAGAGRAALRQALGITGNSKASFMITEDVLTILTDAECQQLSSFLHNLSTVVVHWLTVKDQGSGQDPRMNWKTPSQWKALLPNDLFIQRSGAVVL